MTETLQIMQKEHELWRKHIDTQITALYFGGGTASAIPAKELDNILTSIKKNFRTNLNGEWKFELYPREYNEKKLEETLNVLRKHEFSDLNIDIQSMNQDSLDEIGRGNSSLKAYETLVKKASDFGFSSITTTLMAGLPYETFSSFENGLEIISEIPELTSITVYPIFQRGNEKIKLGTLKGDKYADVATKDTMQAFADLFLQEKGFHQNVFGYYVRDKKKDLSIEDKFFGGDHIGMGTSSRGCFRDDSGNQYHYHSSPDNKDYLNHIRNGRLPVEKIGIMSPQEQGRHYFLQSLCSLEPVDSNNFDKQYGTNLMEQLAQPLSALQNIGVININGKKVQITEPFRSEEIISHLRDPVINAELKNPSYVNGGRNLNWGNHVPDEDKRKILSYMEVC